MSNVAPPPVTQAPPPVTQAPPTSTQAPPPVQLYKGRSGRGPLLAAAAPKPYRGLSTAAPTPYAMVNYIHSMSVCMHGLLSSSLFTHNILDSSFGVCNIDTVPAPCYHKIPIQA